MSFDIWYFSIDFYNYQYGLGSLGKIELRIHLSSLNFLQA